MKWWSWSLLCLNAIIDWRQWKKTLMYCWYFRTSSQLFLTFIIMYFSAFWFILPFVLYGIADVHCCFDSRIHSHDLGQVCERSHIVQVVNCSQLSVLQNIVASRFLCDFFSPFCRYYFEPLFNTTLYWYEVDKSAHQAIKMKTLGKYICLVWIRKAFSSDIWLQLNCGNSI